MIRKHWPSPARWSASWEDSQATLPGGVTDTAWDWPAAPLPSVAKARARAPTRPQPPGTPLACCGVPPSNTTSCLPTIAPSATQASGGAWAPCLGLWVSGPTLHLCSLWPCLRPGALTWRPSAWKAASSRKGSRPPSSLSSRPPQGQAPQHDDQHPQKAWKEVGAEIEEPALGGRRGTEERQTLSPTPDPAGHGGQALGPEGRSPSAQCPSPTRLRGPGWTGRSWR